MSLALLLPVFVLFADEWDTQRLWCSCPAGAGGEHPPGFTTGVVLCDEVVLKESHSAGKASQASSYSYTRVIKSLRLMLAE